MRISAGCEGPNLAPFFVTTTRGRPTEIGGIDDDIPKIQQADVQALSLEVGRRLATRHAGLFLFLPLLAQLRFDRIVSRAGYGGSQMVPAANALLSLLVLKLIDKERLSHIDDFNCDEALGLFAGLNILPKKSFATDYSYRTTRDQQVGLLTGWSESCHRCCFPMRIPSRSTSTPSAIAARKPTSKITTSRCVVRPGPAS